MRGRAGFHHGLLALTCSAVACGDDDGGAANTDQPATQGDSETETDSLPGGTATDDGPAVTTTADDTADDTDAMGSDDGPPPAGVLAGDIAVDAIEINQGVGIELATAGALTPSASRVAPVIGGRSALVRASYTLAPSFTPRTIEGRLWLRDGDSNATYSDERMIAAAPDWESFDGTFHWVVDADDLTANTEFRVQLLELDPEAAPMGDTSGSELPAGEFAALEAWGDPMELHVMLVPFTCSGVPDLDLNPEDLADFEAYIFNTYPVQRLELTVREAVHSDNCNEFEAAENILPDLRASDGAAPWVYYGGLMPGNGGGYSIAVQGGDQMDYRRTFASHTWRDFGLTFDLYAHELGHNHGRDHTFDDPSYPGDNGGSCGSISTYGWGPRSALMPSSGWGNDLDLGLEWFDPHETLLPPTDGSCSGLPEGNRWNFNDMMSYEYPYWVSAYTYAAAAERVRIISGWSAADVHPDPAVGQTLRVVFGPEGDIHRFASAGAITVPTADAWATCEGPDGAVRLPAQRSLSTRELRTTATGVRSFVYESFAVPVPPTIDAATCRLTEGDRSVALASD